MALTDIKVKKVKTQAPTQTRPPTQTPVSSLVPASEPEPTPTPTPTPELEVPVVETVRERLVKMMEKLDISKKQVASDLAFVKSTLKLHDQEVKRLTVRKKTKRILDPNREVAKNGIAKPQVISAELSAFLNKHFNVELGSLVSRTGALSKENGLSKYITDHGLRSNGEIHPDAELIKLIGEPTDLSKDGKSKVFYHKTLMKIIGKHFPQKST